MSKTMNNNHFYSHLRKERLQKFRNTNFSTRRTLENVIIIFQRKYVRPQSQATTKHKWPKFTFDPNTKSLSVFIKELNHCDEQVFESLAQLMTEFRICKVTSTPQTVTKLSLFEISIHDQVIAHLDRELELSGLETDAKLPISTMAPTTTKVTEQTQA